MLADGTEPHGRGYEADGSLVQKGRRGFLLAPAARAQSEPERHREVTRGEISFHLITIFTKERFGSDLIRCNSDHLPSHLAARQAGLTAELCRIQLSINVDRCIQRSRRCRSISLFCGKSFPAAHAASQQIFNVSGKLIGGLDCAALDGCF